jgi:predicted peptidase
MPDSRAVTFLLAALLACGCAAAPPPRQTVRGQSVEEGAGIRYLLHLPAAYESRSEWPLILFLHGAGERGSDVELVKREGLPHILDTLPDFPFVVVSPQETKDHRWAPDALSALLDEVASRYRVDPARVYATGLSSGAVAALELAIRHPERIAAVAAASTSAIPPDLCGMKNVAVWIFHNAGDERVPSARANRLARGLEACGGEVRLTIYPRDGHDAWTETYRRRDLYEWMLSHHSAYSLSLRERVGVRAFVTQHPRIPS